MRKRKERKLLKLSAGICGTTAALLVLLSLLSRMLRKETLGENEILYCIPVACLLSGFAGALLAKKMGSGKTGILLSCMVPAAALLAIAALRGTWSRELAWNGAALCIPCLTILPIHHRKRKRYYR